MTAVRDQFTDPDGRRIGCLALFRNTAGHPLMLRKRNRDELPWCLPGGCAVGGESALAALRRKVLEETGLHSTPGLLLVEYYMPATAGRAEGSNLVFDCGELSPEAEVRLKSEEFSEHAFIAPDQLADAAQPHTAARVQAALYVAKVGGGALFLEGASRPYEP
ncbi:NUDIX hydrolase [Streptomyces sp. NPDC039016]|uniref:NUDIX hydrolase n=1 Tax=Streptomyces sp. NPDC039016 TaxID=3154330 RepID=UPI0033F0ED07